MRKADLTLILALIIAVVFANAGCKKDKENEQEETTDTVVYQQPTVNEEAINQIIGSFPQPTEMASLIKDLGVPFSKKYLADPKIIENYDTNKKKAFALGVLAADLGYLNIYEKSTLIVEYLSSIKRLADALRVGQFFDFQALKRMATNSTNLDTLIFVSSNSFMRMHQHLGETGRSNLSLLMLTGAWLEGLYLLAQVTKDAKKRSDNPDFQQNYEKMKDNIGSQKVLFDILYKVLVLYKDDEYFNQVVSSLKELKDIYSGVTITIIKEQPKIDTQGGRMVIEQGEKSIINITDDQVDAIINTVEKIRNKLINQ